MNLLDTFAEAMELCENIQEDVKDNTQMAITISNLIEESCNKHNVCIKCGKSLSNSQLGQMCNHL